MGSTNIKRTLHKGLMDLDTEERLIEKGYYREAENIRIAKSRSSNIGAAENVRGNYNISNLGLGARTIGKYSVDSLNKIYWFNTSDTEDSLMEYNASSGEVTAILRSSKPGGILNFKPNKLITGIVYIDNDDPKKDLLLWTDDFNPPRKVNIDRAKHYVLDGFTEDDISLIKAPPSQAPQLYLANTSSRAENNLKDKFLSFAYRYKYLDGEYSALSPFTNYAFSPKLFDLDPETLDNKGMENAFNAVDIIFNTGSPSVTTIQLFFKESGSKTIYKIDDFIKMDMGLNNNAVEYFRFFNNKNYAALPKEELYRRYDNVPLKSKALTLAGNRVFFGNYEEGYDISTDKGDKIDVRFTASIRSFNPVSSSFEKTLKSIDNLSDTIVITIPDGVLKNGMQLLFDFKMQNATSEAFKTPVYYMLTKSYDNAKQLSLDKDFINFIENNLTYIFERDHEGTPPAGGTLDSVTGFSLVSDIDVKKLVIKGPILYYINPTSDDPWRFLFESNSSIVDTNSSASVKTLRDYELGIIYLDEYGRGSTPIPSKNNTVFVPQSLSTMKNKLYVDIKSKAPYWAKSFRFAVKESSSSYNTIYATQYYIDNNYRWVKLEGSSRDKVKTGDTLYVKSDLSGPLQEETLVEVLEVTNQMSNFIEGNYQGADELKEIPGLYMKIKPIGFDMNDEDNGKYTFNGSDTDSWDNTRQNEYTFKGLMQDEDMSTGIFTDIPIPANSIIKLKFRNWDHDGEWIKEKQVKVSKDRTSFSDFWNNEIKGHDWIGTDFAVFEGHGTNNRYDFKVVGLNGSGNLLYRTRMTIDIYISLSPGTLIFETKPEYDNDFVFHEISQTFKINSGYHLGNIVEQSASGTTAVCSLNFFNCYVQGNGAESCTYRDKFESNRLYFDLRPMVSPIEPYSKVRRPFDITWSGVYNESTNVNKLNDFNLSTVNYKDDIEKSFGEIKFIHGRDTDLLVAQESKWSKVLYGKNVLYNADDSSNVAKTNSVLGNQVAYAGDFGVSDNPESIAIEGFNVFATDQKRGTVLRLGLNGLTEITKGLVNWFREVYKVDYKLYANGAWDPKYGNYLLNIDSYVSDIERDLKIGDYYIRDNAASITKLKLKIPVQAGYVKFDLGGSNKPVKYVWKVNDVIVHEIDYTADKVLYSMYKDFGDVSADLEVLTAECETNISIKTEMKYNDRSIYHALICNPTDVGKTVRLGYTWEKEGITGGDEFDVYLSTSSKAIFVKEAKSYNDGSATTAPILENSGAGVGIFPPDDSSIVLYAEQIQGESTVFKSTDKMGIRESMITEKPATIIELANYKNVSKSTTPDGREVFKSLNNVDQGKTFLSFAWDLTGNEQVYLSAEVSGDVQYSDPGCVSPNEGSWVTYTVEAGMFTSTISQSDADQQAIDYFNATKQEYANDNGRCIIQDPGGSTLAITADTPDKDMGKIYLDGGNAGEDVSLTFDSEFSDFSYINFILPDDTSLTNTNGSTHSEGVVTLDSNGRGEILYKGTPGVVTTVVITNPVTHSNTVIIALTGDNPPDIPDDAFVHLGGPVDPV